MLNLVKKMSFFVFLSCLSGAFAHAELVNGKVIYVSTNGSGTRLIIRNNGNDYNVYLNLSTSLTQNHIDACQRLALTALPNLNSIYTSGSVGFGIIGTMTSIPGTTTRFVQTLQTCEVY